MWRHGWGLHDGGWFLPHGPVFWLLLIVIVVALVAWFVRAPARSGGAPRSPGLDSLEERYARGDIGRDEYLQKRRDLLG